MATRKKQPKLNLPSAFRGARAALGSKLRRPTKGGVSASPTKGTPRKKGFSAMKGAAKKASGLPAAGRRKKTRQPKGEAPTLFPGAANPLG